MIVNWVLAHGAIWLGACIAVAAAVACARRPDPARILVTVLFVPAFVFAVGDVLRWAGVEWWQSVNLVASVLYLVRAFALLLLASRLRPVHRGYFVVAALLCGGLAGSILLLLPRPYPPALAIGYVVALVAAQAKAAAVFVAEARRRGGLSATRLRVAAAAVVADILRLLVLAVGFGAGVLVRHGDYTLAGVGAVGEVVNLSRFTFAVLAAAGLAVAFLPPAWLRRMWVARSAHDLSSRILTAPADESPEQVWRRYARVVAAVTGSDAVAVATHAAGGDRTALGYGPKSDRDVTGQEREQLVAAARAGAAGPRHGRPDGTKALGRGGRKRTVVVPFADDAVAGAVAVMNHRETLFDLDDFRTLASVAVQAHVLAERSAMLERQRRLLEQRESLAADLAGTLRSLQQADQAKSAFVAAMSHELRTPLNAIIGFSDLMANEPPADGHRTVPESWIEHVRSSGRRLLALVNDLLDAAKVESGRLDVHARPTRLDALATELLDSLRPLLSAKGLTASAALPPLTADVDPFRFRQVLENLLSNAIKFTPDNGAISITGRVDVHGAAIDIADSGPGITAEDQARLFQQFQQVGDATGQRKGTGLGLYLARQIARAHDGDLTVRSQPGHGSVFTVSIPATRIVGGPLPEHPTSRATVSRAPR